MVIRKDNAFDATNIFLLLLFVYPIINDYIRYIVNMIIPVHQATFDIIIWICSLILLGGVFFKRISLSSICIWLAFFVISLFSFILTDYDWFDFSRLAALNFTIIPALFLGANIIPNKITLTSLYKASVLALIIAALYNIYSIATGRALLSGSGNMRFAYEILPAVLITIVNAIESKKKVVPCLMMSFALLLLLLQGNRGTILCVIVFIMINIIKRYGLNKSVIWALVGMFLLVILVSSGILQMPLLKLIDRIDAAGFSSRLLRLLIEGDISTDNGRTAIQEILIKEIQDHPFQIRGLYADYEWTKGLMLSASYGFETGIYAHNIVLELIFSYGIIFGGTAFVVLVVNIIGILKRFDNESFYLAAIFVCTGFVNLFVSGTYLNSAIFFALIGLFINKKTSKQYKGAID